MVKRNLVALIISLLFTAQAVASPDNSMSITPTASSGETISASDENSRNNEISTKYNAHGHSDTNDLSSNTLTLGDGAVGSKTYAVDTDQANDPGLRYNTTVDQWQLSQDGSTYLAAAHAETTSGLTSGAMLFASGGTVSGAIADAGVASNGQFLIGRTGASPVLGSLTGSGGITITPGAGTIEVGGAGLGTPALTLSTTNSAGVATTAIRTDATVAAFDATVPTGVEGSAATGSVAFAARRDHQHNMLGPPFTNIQVFSSTDTWTRPAGVDSVYVEAWGGGGGGGESATDSTASGGGGGEYAAAVIAVTGNVTVTVGTGGAAGDSGAGGNGVDSTFVGTTTLTANGGTGGAATASNGEGGTGSTNTIAITGERGQYGDETSAEASGGSAPQGGSGGRGGVAGADGVAGTVPGGGGSAGSGAGTAGAGAAGRVIVYWNQ